MKKNCFVTSPSVVRNEFCFEKIISNGPFSLFVGVDAFPVVGAAGKDLRGKKCPICLCVRLYVCE
jgi:hypothetical protein